MSINFVNYNSSTSKKQQRPQGKWHHSANFNTVQISSRQTHLLQCSNITKLHASNVKTQTMCCNAVSSNSFTA